MPRKMSGEAFTIALSGTVDFFFQALEIDLKHIHFFPRDGGEKTAAIKTCYSGSLLLGNLSTRIPIVSIAAARRISRANSSGERRSAENTSSGNSSVTVVISYPPGTAARPFQQRLKPGAGCVVRR